MGMTASESQFHVLAVDDSLLDRKLIERLLKTSSYQVTTVDSGSKALEFLGFHENDLTHSDSPSVSPNNHQYVEVNLIITDYCMPGMTGYELLKKIKESSSLRNIPVVIMSSENVPSRINRCLEEGAEEFFLKPVQLSDLQRLRPHIMKTKLMDQNFEAEQQNQPIKHRQQQQQQDKKLDKQQKQESHDSEILHIEQQQQQQEIPNNNNNYNTPVNTNNKRKAMEESLSPDRTRPRYNGLTPLV